MVGKSKPKTKEDKERIEISKLYISCLPCILVGLLNSHADYQHVVEAQRRLGHKCGYSSCLWHHRGEKDGPWRELTTQAMIGMFGPSLAHGKKPFRAFFGSELLLVRAQDFAIKLYKRYQWNEFEMSQFVGSRIRSYHIDLMRKAR